MIARIAVLALAAACALPASAQAAKPDQASVAVCNEAENSFRGGYDITVTNDPNPPAFLRGEQMAVGNGHGAGLVNAAAHSPALVVCSDGDTGGDGGDGGTGLPLPELDPTLRAGRRCLPRCSPRITGGARCAGRSCCSG